MPNSDRSNMSLPKANMKSTSTFKATVQRSITQSRNGKPPVTHTMRQSADAHFINGQLKTGNVEYVVRSDDNDALDMLRNQEQDLEIMMRNYRIDDEEFVDASDIIDNMYSDKGLPAIENGNVLKEKIITNGSNRKPLESPTYGSPKKPVSKYTIYRFLYSSLAFVPLNTLFCNARNVQNDEQFWKF